jgi:hypothetical protein
MSDMTHAADCGYTVTGRPCNCSCGAETPADDKNAAGEALGGKEKAPTPETDSVVTPCVVFHGPQSVDSMVLADFARRLERERNHWRGEALEQARLLGKGGEREARLIAERDEAREALIPFISLNPNSQRVKEKWDGFVQAAKKALEAAK